MIGGDGAGKSTLLRVLAGLDLGQTGADAPAGRRSDRLRPVGGGCRSPISPWTRTWSSSPTPTASPGGDRAPGPPRSSCARAVRRPPRSSALGRAAAQAGRIAGPAGPARPARPRRSHHRGRSGQPDGALAADCGSRCVRGGRGHEHHLSGRGRAAPKWSPSSMTAGDWPRAHRRRSSTGFRAPSSTAPTPADPARAWRRGARWRQWDPGADPAGGLWPTLEDAAIVHELLATEIST